MKKIIYSIFVLLLISTSCQKAKEKNTSKEFLQGTWKNYTDPNTFYFAGSSYNFTFKQDSFFCKWYYYTDALIVNDPCDGRQYFNYIAGAYELNEDKIILDGQYVADDYAWLNTDTCSKIGSYAQVNKIVQKGDTLIIDLPFSLEMNFNKTFKFLKE